MGLTVDEMGDKRPIPVAEAKEALAAIGEGVRAIAGIAEAVA